MAGLSLPHVLPRIDRPELETRKYTNFLLALMARRRNASVVGSSPFEITIDPSTICQLQCPYCEVGNGTIRRTRALLKPETHRGFVEQLADDMFIAWYFSTGEPLINRSFADLVSAVGGRGVFSVVSTNLSLKLSDQRIDEILMSGLGVICVSLDGVQADTYVRYRVGGEFDLVVENMRRLIRRKRELGLEFPLIEWRFLVFRHNQHEIPRVRERAAELGVDLLEFFPGYGPADAGPGQVQPPEGADFSRPVSGPAFDRAVGREDTTLRRLLRGVELVDAPPPPETTHLKCDWLYFGATLFPDGSISPCCVSNNQPDDFGKIEPGGTFREVWNNEKFRQARGMFVDQSRPDLVCSRCPLPAAHDYQFRTSLRAILRNAPDWALWLMAHQPHRFFFEVDFLLSPVELSPFRDGRINVKPGLPEGLPLRAVSPEAETDLDWIRDCLADAS